MIHPGTKRYLSILLKLHAGNFSFLLDAFLNTRTYYTNHFDIRVLSDPENSSPCVHFGTPSLLINHVLPSIKISGSHPA